MIDWRSVPCSIGRTKNPHKYRMTHESGRPVYMHVTAYVRAYGPPPPERPFVCHHCDTPACDEPLHLFAGSNADNMADASAKGRLVRGAETRARLAALATGRHPSAETRALISEHRSGIGHTDEARERIGVGLRRAYAEGRR